MCACASVHACVPASVSVLTAMLRYCKMNDTNSSMAPMNSSCEGGEILFRWNAANATIKVCPQDPVRASVCVSCIFGDT